MADTHCRADDLGSEDMMMGGGPAERPHRLAMELADEADAMVRQGRPNDALARYGDAFDYERIAAINTGPDRALSRAILHRSAAWLAIKAGRLREAERIAARGLSFGDVPRTEARDLREALAASWGGGRGTAEGARR